MSLHAQPSSEALDRLHRQRRNSTITSIIISIFTVALVAIVMGILLLPSLVTVEPPDFEVIKGKIMDKPEPETTVRFTKVPRDPSPPAAKHNKMLAADTVSPVALQAPDVVATVPSFDFGNSDFHGYPGDEDGFKDVFTDIDGPYQKRCSLEDRMARLEDMGGKKQCEAAVEKALEYLRKTQNSDGSWEGTNKSAMTGLALLAYLGRCETPHSVKYGDTVARAITYLVNVGMRNEGRLIQKGGETANPWCYEHAIATYALGEASTFCKEGKIDIPNLFDITQKAGQFIIDNQNADGGWAYAYRTQGGHTDLSVVAWQLQALKACEHSGLEFKNMRKAVSKGLEYVGQRQGNSGGFSYTGRADGSGKYWNLTGSGLLCMQIWDKGSNSSARKAAKYIHDNSRFKYDEPGHASDLYCHYYEAQAMMNRGGAEWRKYNANFRDELLAAQETDGSFKQPGDTKHQMNRAHYRTCMAVLMLEVYYRFLPGTGAQR